MVFARVGTELRKRAGWRAVFGVTAAFLAFLMHVCEREQAATQYALLSALFGFTRSLAGAVSGLGASRLGYAPYFAATFALALPAYALLPWLRPWIHDRPPRA